MSTRQTMAYSLEIIQYARHCGDELEQALAPSAEPVQSLLSNPYGQAGSGVIGASVYDVATRSGEMADDDKRSQARLLALANFCLCDITDDLLDETENGFLSGAEREAIILSVANAVLDEEPPTSDDVRFQAAVILGRYTSNILGETPSHKRVGLHYLQAEREFDTDPSFDDTLKYVRNLGTCVGDIFVSPVEFVHDKAFPAISAAYHELGRYGLILDHAYEIGKDLQEGVPSLVTTQLPEGEVTLQTIQQAREVCLDIASDHIKTGEEQLEAHELPPYKAIRKLLDIHSVLKRRLDNRHIKRLLPERS